MCVICDGASYDEMLQMLIDRVDDNGWTMVGVEGPTPWAYTVGFRWNFDHPELIFVGGCPQTWTTVAEVVSHCADEGEGLMVGDDLVGPHGTFHIGHVHPDNLANGWFATWPLVARASGHGTTSLRAVQVIPPEHGSCPHCSSDHVLLDRRRSTSSFTGIPSGCARPGARR